MAISCPDPRTKEFGMNGLVDAGVVPDDTAEQVARRWPVFAAPCKEVPGGSRFLLVVERLA